MGGQVDKIRNSLGECQVMAEDYLAHRTASKQKLMINSLQSIAKKLNLEFYSLPGTFIQSNSDYLFWLWGGGGRGERGELGIYNQESSFLLSWR